MEKDSLYKYRHEVKPLSLENMRVNGLKALLRLVKVFMKRNPQMPIPILRKNMDRVLHLYNLSDMRPKYPIQIEHMYAEWVVNKKCPYDKVILYLHGGGYALGSCNTHRSLVNRIAESTAVKALLIEYALAPEAPFPAGLHDALLGYEWLIAQGYQAKDIILMGDSAGGGLALSTFLTLKERNMPLPGGIVCLSPWTDLSCTRHSFKTNGKKDMIVQHAVATRLASDYVGDDGFDFFHPQISPIFGNYEGCPPILIQASTAEVLYNDSKDLATLLKNQELPVSLQAWDDMPHVWQIFSDILPQGRQAIESIAHFVRQNLGLELKNETPEKFKNPSDIELGFSSVP